MNEKLFWSRVEKSDGCWLWTDRLDRNGYGRYAGKAAHRIAYQVVIGEIPDGLTIDHLCFVTHCVNPSHMELVTPRENLLRQRSASKSECTSGHPYTPENTYIRPNGRRDCRACIRRRVTEYQKRKQNGVAA